MAEDAPPLSTEVPGEPFIQVTPNYGRMSTRDEDHQAVSGSRVRVVGRSFEANTPTGIFEVEFTMPYRLTSATERGVQIHQIEARQTFRLARPVPSEALLVTIARMIETIFMGMMATVFGNRRHQTANHYVCGGTANDIAVYLVFYLPLGY